MHSQHGQGYHIENVAVHVTLTHAQFLNWWTYGMHIHVYTYLYILVR